jgi:hypothetical protein
MDLIKEGDGEAIYSLYSNLAFRAEDIGEIELAPDVDIAERLINHRAKEGSWAIELGRLLIIRRDDWKSAFRALKVRDPSTKLLLDLLLRSGEELLEVTKAAIANIDTLSDYSVRALGRMEFWKDAPPSLVLSALSSRNPSIAQPVLESLLIPSPRTKRRREVRLSLLEAKPLEWWLSWQGECLKSDAHIWCGWRLGQFLRNDYLARPQLLKIFNHGSVDDFRRVGNALFHSAAMLGIGTITTDDLSEAAINCLLNKGRHFNFSADVLGYAATEEFVQSVLLPHRATHPNALWVREAIEIAGDRHNRRYLGGEHKSFQPVSAGAISLTGRHSH